MSYTRRNDHKIRSCLLLYGTETGNSQDIAYEISQCVERLHFATTTRELDAASLQDLTRYDLVVFAISTTGQGHFPSNARKFWLNLLRRKLTAVSLAGARYALIGLCDSSYPKFNLAGRKLHKRLQQLGAKSIIRPCEADEQGEEGTEGAFVAWLSLFQKQVLAEFPLGNDQTPIEPGQRLPSAWSLVEATKSNQNDSGLDYSDASAFVQISLAPPDPVFQVVLEQNERVTPSEHWQDVRMMKFRAASAINYMPGDALAIRPQNSSDDVDMLIELQGWQSIADNEVELLRTRARSPGNEIFDSALADQRVFTLRKLLTQYLDINAIPRRSFFTKMVFFTADETQKERALEFTDPQFLDEYFDYATRPRRSILEVLQEFNTVKIPWQEAINVFPIMRPRQFSIASGGYLTEGGHVFELLVAIVKYRTVIKRIREGVCTKYLAGLPIGTHLSVVLHTEGRFHNRFLDLDRPHLLIGGGTGIAPLRSIIHEKERKFQGFAKSILVFGCRSNEADYFFREEWSQLESRANASLRVVTAFSRNQPSKVYVQDKIRENAAPLRDFLDDPRAMVIVCGSSGAMPKAVRQALRDIIIHPPQTVSAAEDILVQLEKENRYKQETW